MKLNELVDLEQKILDAPMMEMANLYPKETGLSTVIWLGEVGGQHGPRIKVSNVPGKFAANDNFVISVSRNPVVLTPKSMKLNSRKLEDLLDWVILNYEVLMELWNIHESGDGSAHEVIQNLQRL